MKPVYGETARAFDAVAPYYDAVYGPQGNAVMTWMRRESLALLKATFPRESYLLELGCGSGEEAVAMAKAGRRVLATDLSPKMAARTQAKARAAHLDHRLAVAAMPASGAAALRPGAPFDGAYASFGVLNCEPGLPRLGAALTRLVRPGGAFVCSVMGGTCPFEIAWFLLHGRPDLALRRWRPGWQEAPVAGRETVEGSSAVPVSVATRYLNVGTLRKAFAPAFTLERSLSLPLLLPPPYLDVLFQRHRDLFAKLEPLERRLRQRWPWRLWGDHVILVLRRASPAA
jgi:SAM-dependent methyltransferase